MDDVDIDVEDIAQKDSFYDEEKCCDDLSADMMKYAEIHEKEGFEVFQFDADDSELVNIIGLLEERLDAMGASMKAVMQISVSVEELFVNISHYAYGDKKGKMLLCLKFAGENVEIRFVDRGTPFDPLAMEEPDITLEAEERQIGGLGILMVKKVMDDVIYRYENKQNILTIVKKIA